MALASDQGHQGGGKLLLFRLQTDCARMNSMRHAAGKTATNSPPDLRTYLQNKNQPCPGPRSGAFCTYRLPGAGRYGLTPDSRLHRPLLRQRRPWLPHLLYLAADLRRQRRLAWYKWPHRHPCPGQFPRGRRPPDSNHTRLQSEPCNTPSDLLPKPLNGGEHELGPSERQMEAVEGTGEAYVSPPNRNGLNDSCLLA